MIAVGAPHWQCSIRYRLNTRNWIKVIALTENGGAGTARNVGWTAAAHAYIAFLDSDDSWHPQIIETQYSWIIKHHVATLTGRACQHVDDESINNGQVDFFGADPEFFIERDVDCIHDETQCSYTFVQQGRIYIKNGVVSIKANI